MPTEVMPCPLSKMCPEYRPDWCNIKYNWQRCVIYLSVKAGAKPSWLKPKK